MVFVPTILINFGDALLRDVIDLCCWITLVVTFLLIYIVLLIFIIYAIVEAVLTMRSLEVVEVICFLQVQIILLVNDGYFLHGEFEINFLMWVFSLIMISADAIIIFFVIFVKAVSGFFIILTVVTVNL